jgi:hypothetical protein
MVDGSTELVGEMENLGYVPFGFITSVYRGHAWESTNFTTRGAFLQRGIKAYERPTGSESDR